MNNYHILAPIIKDMKLNKSEKIFFLLIFILSFLSAATIYTFKLNFPPIRSDGIGYYSYLPAIFIHKNLDFEPLLQEKFSEEGYVPESWGGIRYYEKTDKYIDKYPIGIAVMLLPFFLTAHLLTLVTGINLEGGFSEFYQLSIGLAGILYFILGLFVLKKILDKYFDSKVVYITLLLITFGTNLFHYGTYDATFSHVFSFFLINSFVYSTLKWHKKQSWKNTLLIGLLAGFIILVRPTNAFILLLFPLYKISSFKNLAANYKLFSPDKNRDKLKILIIVLIGIIILLPQFLYLKYATGGFFTFPYEDFEGFNFFRAEIGNVLFSVRKGLFFWSPILLFSIPGLFLMFKNKDLKKFLLPFVLILIIGTWIIFSWWHWPYGGSFGHRAFIDLFVFFALPLATFINWILNQKQALRYILIIMMVLCSLLTSKLMIQYWLGVIKIDGTTWEQYTDNFFTFRDYTKIESTK